MMHTDTAGGGMGRGQGVHTPYVKVLYQTPGKEVSASTRKTAEFFGNIAFFD